MTGIVSSAERKQRVADQRRFLKLLPVRLSAGRLGGGCSAVRLRGSEEYGRLRASSFSASLAHGYSCLPA